MVCVCKIKPVAVIDCLIIYIIGMNAAFLLMVSPICKQSLVSQTAWLLLQPLWCDILRTDSSVCL